MTFGVLAAVAASSPSSNNDVTPGVLGFLVVAAMGVALVFLLKSMNKQFRKIEPKAEGATGLKGAKGFDGVKGSKPDPGEPSAPDTPR